MDGDSPNGTELTLIVETADGVILRRIQPALTLPLGADPGPAAEDATRNAAAVFGLPDFVFRPDVRSVGSRIRELGDAIVTVGDVAAAVQVKARATPSGNACREAGWLDSRIKKAVGQARGTIQALNRGTTTLTNERGRAIPIYARTKTWVSVVVIDHARPPSDYLPNVPSPTVVLLRRDWEFLFEQLRSTDAVIRYLHRVSSRSAIPLGEEPLRYYQLANADAAAEPEPPDPRITGPGMGVKSSPLLPLSPADDTEGRYHMLFRFMLEDIATSPRPEKATEADVLMVLAAIDRLPVAYRAELGEALMTWLRDAASVTGPGVRWQFRRVVFPDRPHLVFATANQWNKGIQQAFSMFVTLRHQQLVEMLEKDDDLLTVGVLLTPTSRGERPWDTSMAATRGRLDLSPDYRRELEELWPIRPSESHLSVSA